MRFPTAAHEASPPQYTITTADLGELQAIGIRVGPDQVVVHLTGEIDLATAGVVSAVLARELALGNRSVRLDLAGVRFLDCTALGVLVVGHGLCVAGGATLALTGVGERTGRLLSITGLNEVLFVADDRGATR